MKMTASNHGSTDGTTSAHVDVVAKLTQQERDIINRLQRGVPLTPDPYGDLAQELGITSRQLLDSLRDLLERGVLSRFGPMFQAERMAAR